MAAANPTAAEMLQQIVLLSDQLQTAMARITALEAPEVGLDLGDGTRQKGGIFDKTNMIPDKLSRQVDFKDLSEEYLEYIEAQDEKLAGLMTTARDSQQVINGMGEDECTVKQAKALYRSMKRNVVFTEAKPIVVSTPKIIPLRPGGFYTCGLAHATTAQQTSWSRTSTRRQCGSLRTSWSSR